MLSVLARPHLFNRLLEPTRLNLLVPKQQSLNRPQLQSFKSKRNLEELSQNTNGNLRQWLDSKLFRASVSAVGGSVLFFTGSAVWSYEKIRSTRQANPFYQQNPFYQKNSKSSLATWWASIREHEKLTFSIIALNLLVFAAWRVPQLEPIMYKYFALSITNKSPTFLPMLLSTFSHCNATHLFFNMFCLHSFAAPVTFYWGKESTLALYLSAGMFGSLASTVLKLRSASLSYSLGASAAILGLVASSCVLQPELQISLIFLPMFTFTAQNALLGLLALDVSGLLLGWKYFDHAGHLGGMLFGIWYTKLGHKTVNRYRKKVARVYHQIRSSKK